MVRVMAAMSGGVDSSLAAAMAVADRHEVVGVTLRQWDDPDEVVRRTKGCSVVDAVADARRVADVLSIPHYTFDFRDIFEREVIGPFASEYAAGRTPNPCVRCNQRVRFGALLDKARRLGFDALLTGHHARLVVDGARRRLLRGADPARDQSYVLYALSQDALASAMFPVGDMPTKAAVREAAAALGLPTAGRQESVDVCFVPEDRSPADIVADRVPMAVRRGPIMDEAGQVVGEHRGLAHYTVGQRKGLGAFGTRRYVASIDAGRNALIIGDDAAVAARGLRASDPNWLAAPPADGSSVEAVVRYQGAANPAEVTHRPDGFELRFQRPVRAVAPGQAVVIYAGDEVLGGGTIITST